MNSPKVRTEYELGGEYWIEISTSRERVLKYARRISRGLQVSGFALRQFADEVIAVLEDGNEGKGN